MPTCNQCLTPCNCLMSEDGFRAGRGNEDGRRNSVLTGVGTTTDPYVVQFQMSGEYRPPAGELRAANLTVNNTSTKNVTSADAPSIYWDSPDSVFTFYPGVLLTLTTGNYHVVGASASFAANSTGVRRLALLGTDETGGTYTVAGDEQSGHATKNTILTCSGFNTGVLTPSPAIFVTFSNTKINTWAVGLWQNSGVPLLVTCKFWMVTA